ncbi:MAG: HU family DNA-binding protein [Acidimicrobiales bacterium]|jgi:DNA-binding protein HU-beta|nr:HU family DNA-binding protein [Acidimicrobiales bacterium]
MNKSDLIAAMAGKAGMSNKDAGDCLDAFLDVVADVVAAGEEKLSITGWLSFEQVTRNARMGRNPQTGEALHVPATKACKVSVGSKLKAAAKSGGAPAAPEAPEAPASSW